MKNEFQKIENEVDETNRVKASSIEENQKEEELNDNFYWLNASLDMQIARLIYEEKIVIERSNQENAEVEFITWDGKIYQSAQSTEKLKKLIYRIICTLFGVSDFMKEILELSNISENMVAEYRKDFASIDFRKKLTTAVLNELSGMQLKMFSPDELDSSAFAINTQNGIIDLRTLKLVPHNQDFLFTKIMNASFLEEIEIEELYKTEFCRVIKEALRDPMKTEEENNLTFTSVLNLLGYLLIKGNPKRKIPIIVGPTASGKSLITKTLNEIFGSYAGSTSSSAFMKTNRSQNDIRPELIKNVDTRILSVVETDEETEFDTALLKSFSGGDLLSYRKPYKSTVTFRFQGIVMFLTNFIPKFSNIEDTAFLDRLLLVNFKNSVPEEKRDVLLDKKLMEEKDKILTLLIYHASLYFKANNELLLSNDFAVNKKKLVLERSNLAKKFIEDKIVLLSPGELSIGQVKYSKAFIYNIFYRYCTQELKIEKIPKLRKFFYEFDQLMEYCEGVVLKKSSSFFYTGFNINGAGFDPTFYKNIISDEVEDRLIKRQSTQSLIINGFQNDLIANLSRKNSPVEVSSDNREKNINSMISKNNEIMMKIMMNFIMMKIIQQ